MKFPRDRGTSLNSHVKAREGDFIETVEGLIFDVKGLIHPPNRIISFLRYIPSVDGERERNGVRYKKIYDLEERWRFLRKHFPNYICFDAYFGRELQSVPSENVRMHYNPKMKLAELVKKTLGGSLEGDAVDLARTLEENTKVEVTNFGISGSILVDLQESDSDIDLIIYGVNASKSVHKSLRELLSAAKTFRPYDLNDLKHLYRSRSMENAMTFDDFCVHEQRKVLEGSFRGRDYFIRCIRDWNEIQESYGSFTIRRIGKAKIHAVVSDDSESIFTPCIYPVEHVEQIENEHSSPKRILSFRGRFCEQAKEGEKVIAFGELEEVVTEKDEFSQLVVGESPHDFMVRI